MSVQTQIDRINTEVTTQTSLLSQIQTALEGKAAGGGTAVETCTVEIIYEAPTIGANLSYINEAGEVAEATYTASEFMQGITLTIRANSPIIKSNSFGQSEVTGDVLKMNDTCYYIKSDATITVVG